jgi:hypothetical protein
LISLFLVVCGGGAEGGKPCAQVPAASTVAARAVLAGLEPANTMPGYLDVSTMVVVISAGGSAAAAQGPAIALMTGPGGNPL